jgi:hypothetical protein
MSSKPRARKAKNVPVTEEAAASPAPAPAPAPAPVEEPASAAAPAATKKSRSAKKTPPIVATVTPAGITGSFLAEQRPLIVHLPVSSAAVNFDHTNIVGNSEVPKPYDSCSNEIMYLDGVNQGAGVESDRVLLAKAERPIHEVEETKCKLPSHYSEKLMVLFQDSNRYQKLPEKTDIACFWCCHDFQSVPFAIPSHILDEIWYMYGNFCSAECATAYLFKERVDSHVQWERYALLNSLYASNDQLNPNMSRGIRPAPPREVLRMFGGSMDISEYRALVQEKRLRVDVLTPPMVSIIQTMDTKPIDFYDQNLKNVFIRNDIQHKYNGPGAQGLRLRRSKPVKSREATVEWAMQIQQVGGGAGDA